MQAAAGIFVCDASIVAGRVQKDPNSFFYSPGIL